MKPIVLIPSGEGDADFIYATGLAVETSLYIRFGEGDDVLVTSPLEIERARMQSKAVRKLLLEEAGYEAAGPFVSYARLAARMLRGRGLESARVSPRLQAGYLEAMREAGLDVEVDAALFQAERRRKSAQEAGFIEASQRAAEAAVVEVVSQLAQADIRDGILWLDERPLTSERLYARASLLLGERGFVCPDMIIAGSPECAMPHYRGEGPIRANGPVIIDIFPGSRNTHYHGDLTRTVVVGEVPEGIRTMHAAVLQALDAGIETIKAGACGRDVHHGVCQVLVDRGFGTTTKGFEGADGGAQMNHSTGHGVGLDVHEEPALRGPDENTLHEGDVVTVEPGLYLLGLGGVRIEDTGMVTTTGFKNFTTLTRSLDPRDYL
ncbi:MAG: M24 family metallopeptidase [Candidatus Dormibacteraceae bacterium]